MSKWDIGKIPKVELVLQLATFLSVFLGIPFLRQMFGFIYLSFLPGFLILKVVKPNKLTWTETAFLSLGLSIGFLMLLGLLLNEIGSVLGVTNPLSTLPIFIVVFAATMVLYLATYRRGADFLGLTRVVLKSHVSAVLLFSISAIIIFGTILGSTSGNSLVLLFLVILVSALVLCSFSKKLVPSELHPLVIFVVSFFLIFHLSLLSKYLIGYDINLEMYFAKLTYNASFWDRNIFYTFNSMLSVTILPVMYSNFLGLDLNWVFKIVYPLIYSIIPLILYLAYRKLTSSRIAFLSVFLFISWSGFWLMIGLARQMIAELFFALLILLIVEDVVSLTKRRLLFVIFGASLIVSQYSLSYILLFYFCLTIFALSFFGRSDTKPLQLLNGKLVLSLVGMAVFWYFFVSPQIFWNLANAVNNIYVSLLELSSGPGISALMPAYFSPLHEVSKYLFYLIQGLVILGLLGLTLNPKKTKLNQEYISMSLISVFILVLTIAVPTFAAALNISRWYSITLFFLAPFSVLGCIAIFRVITSNKLRLLTFSSRQIAGARRIGLFLLSVLLISFFLFQVGFIYEITGDIPTSLPLSLNRMQANPFVNIELWSTYIPEQDGLGATWLSERCGNQSEVYGDSVSRLAVLTSYGPIPLAYSGFPQTYNYQYMLSEEGNNIAQGAYVFLRQFNVVYGKMRDTDGKLWTANFSSLSGDYDKIYSNGGSEIYIRT